MKNFDPLTLLLSAVLFPLACAFLTMGLRDTQVSPTVVGAVSLLFVLGIGVLVGVCAFLALLAWRRSTGVEKK